MIFAEIWAASYETRVQFTFCMSEAAGRKGCLLFLASWGELKKMASRLYAKLAYSQWSVNSDTRFHPFFTLKNGWNKKL